MSDFENGAKTVCPQCGQELEAGAKFCSGCGSKIEPPVVEAVPVQEEIKINYEPVVESTAYDTATNVYNSTPVYQAQPENTNKNMIGVSIGSLVCGVLSLICCCTGFFGLLLAVAGIVLGIVALKCGYAGKGMAIAGIAVSGVSLFIVIILLICSGAGMFDELVNEITYYM